MDLSWINSNPQGDDMSDDGSIAPEPVRRAFSLKLRRLKEEDQLERADKSANHSHSHTPFVLMPKARLGLSQNRLCVRGRRPCAASAALNNKSPIEPTPGAGRGRREAQR
jgi:hypothetical protein